MQLYLITGFLGAGKTTFLKSFIRQFESKKIFLLINEFGKAGVDGALLREMDATLSEINNGSIFCSCRIDKFAEVLAGAITQKPDIILIEASGLADPTNVRKHLAQKQYREIEFMGSICLVDALRFEKIVDTARVCPKQIAVSSLAIINKTDLADNSLIDSTIKRIKELNPSMAIRKTTYGAFEREWLSLILPQAVIDEPQISADLTLQKACLTLSNEISLAQLNSLLAMLCEDTYRIKGFVKTTDGVMLVDCVGPMVLASAHNGAYNELGKIVLLAGKGMALRKAVKCAREWYPNYITEVEL